MYEFSKSLKTSKAKKNFVSRQKGIGFQDFDYFQFMMILLLWTVVSTQNNRNNYQTFNGRKSHSFSERKKEWKEQKRFKKSITPEMKKGKMQRKEKWSNSKSMRLYLDKWQMDICQHIPLFVFRSLRPSGGKFRYFILYFHLVKCTQK